MNKLMLSLTLLIAIITAPLQSALARDLKEIKQEGVLRHLGVPYANFVDGADNGLDVELMRLFAKELGVRYEYVETNWKTVISDLTGQQQCRWHGGVRGDRLYLQCQRLPHPSQGCDGECGDCHLYLRCAGQCPHDYQRSG